MVDAPVPLVALIGAPRSGTTWLQNLIGADPRVVSPQETSLFSRYVAPLDESWRLGLRGSVDDWAKRRFIGLGAVLTEAEFTELVQGLVQQALCKVLALKPGAALVLEKTPSHSLHVETIARYAPQVRFLHIVRDGRDVAASLVDAAQGWGSSWGAPSTVARAARTWVDYVEGARTQTAAPYRETRYEDLRREGAHGELEQIFEFCGVPIEAEVAQRRLEEFSLARQRSDGTSSVVFGGEASGHDRAGAEPTGFFGSGHERGWRTEWTVRERVEFDAVAGDLLRELGYESDDAWIGEPRAARRARRKLTTRGRTARVLRAVGRRVERAGERYGGGLR